MKQKLTLTYLGFVSGFLVLMLLNSSVWLEMRVNTALVLPVFTLASLAASFWHSKRVHPGLFFGLQGCLVLFFLLKYQFDITALALLPAIWFKEGFFLSSLEITAVNGVMITIVILGNVLLWLPQKNVE